MNLTKNILLFFLITALLSGCSYLRMTYERARLYFSASGSRTPDDIKHALPEQCGVLTGRLVSDSLEGRPFVIIAFSTQFSRNCIVDYTVLPEPGPYMLYVPEGEYNILAFADFNGNLICEQNEFVGQRENPDVVSVAPGQVVGELDIVISSAGKKLFDFPIDLKIPHHKDTKPIALEHGGIINFDDEIFSRKYGSIGLWSPSEFIERVGVNVYALEKFDATKTPILFVHASGGTPRDWELIVNNIDRHRYQPWFFYYPSGLGLETLSDLLYEKLNALYKRYKFGRLFITAHSMGGLVVRSLINQYGSDMHAHYLRLFVSIGTPWGGIDRAKWAGQSPLKSLEYIPPSWKDLASGSKFIEDLYKKKIPPHLTFYLFFGYKGDNPLLKGADDGTVALKSQLDLRAQSEATRCFGFNEDHVSILFSREVLGLYNELLANIETKPIFQKGLHTTKETNRKKLH